MFRPSFILRHRGRFLSTNKQPVKPFEQKEANSFLLTFVSKYGHGWPGVVCASVWLAFVSSVGSFVGTYPLSCKIDHRHNQLCHKLDHSHNQLCHKLDHSHNQLCHKIDQVERILLDHRDWMMKAVERQDKQIYKQKLEFAKLHEEFIHSQDMANNQEPKIK